MMGLRTARLGEGEVGVPTAGAVPLGVVTGAEPT